MKPITKLTLSLLATTGVAASAVHAGEMAPNRRPARKQATVVSAGAKSTQIAVKINKETLIYREVPTGQGTIGFFAPAR